MEGLLTHVATADCFITPPHPVRDCGIVTAWWHYQVKGTRPHRGSTDEQRKRRDSAPEDRAGIVTESP